MVTRGKPFPEYVTTRSVVAPAPGSVYPSIVGPDGKQFTYAQLVALIVANAPGGGGEIDGGTPSTVF